MAAVLDVLARCLIYGAGVAALAVIGYEIYRKRELIAWLLKNSTDEDMPW